MHRLLQYSLLGCGFLSALLMISSAEKTGQAADVKAAPHKTYTETIPGSKVSFEMMAIPGGTFLMGSPDNEAGRSADEGPRHPVTLRPFWLGKCEVTWDEFDRFWKREDGVKPETPQDKAADAITAPTPAYVDETYGHGRENHPVLCMTHHCAMEYCRWLSAKTGKLYRLPTEAEWEFAARAGTQTAYSFGDDPKNLGDYAWYAKNSEELTHEVGKKKPNPWGLYDMYGNVSEYCLDHYQKDSYAQYPKDRPTLSPVLLPTDKRFSHVVRGGSWSDEPAKLRSAARLGSDPSWMKHDPQRPQSIWWLTKWDYVGFRVARAVDEQDNLKSLKSKITKESD